MTYEHFVEIGFGAALGSILTFVNTLVQEKVVKQAERKSKLTALLAEMKDNKTSVDAGIKSGHATQRLYFGMWEEVRSEIFSLPTDMCEELRRVYHKIAQYNSVQEYDLALVTNKGVGQGTFDSVLHVVAQEISTFLESSIVGLETYLNKAV